jgi:uncharacterized membrane protein
MMPWWTDQQAGWIGGIGGGIFGIIAGAWGSVAGVSAPQGKRRGLVYMSAGFLIVAGAISLITGLAAASLQQPFFVYYPLIVLGGLCLMLLVLLPMVRQRYREADHRRLEAEELRRS